MNLLGINFYAGTYENLLTLLKNTGDNKTTLIVTPNPEMLYEASRDSALLKILQEADIALPDGAGIFVAYQLQDGLVIPGKDFHGRSQGNLRPGIQVKIYSSLSYLRKVIFFPFFCLRAIIHSTSFTQKYGERITGSGLTRDLLKHASENTIPVTIIDPIVHGVSPRDLLKKQSQDSMKEILEEKYPGIICQIVISDTIFELTNGGTDKLNNLQIDQLKNGIIFATHGNGTQEKLLSELKKTCQNSLLIGAGSSIDLITGFRQPIPRFFQRFGGEWLYRLYQNPQKHIKRMRKVIRFLFDQIHS